MCSRVWQERAFTRTSSFPSHSSKGKSSRALVRSIRHGKIICILKCFYGRIYIGKASLLTAVDTSHRHTVCIAVKRFILVVGKEQNVLLVPKLLLYPRINHGEKRKERESVLDTFCLNTMIYLQGQRNVRCSAVSL